MELWRRSQSETSTQELNTHQNSPKHGPKSPKPAEPRQRRQNHLGFRVGVRGLGVDAGFLDSGAGFGDLSACFGGFGAHFGCLDLADS